MNTIRTIVTYQDNTQTYIKVLTKKDKEEFLDWLANDWVLTEAFRLKGWICSIEWKEVNTTDLVIPRRLVKNIEII